MQENKYSIRQWAKDDQPREKLLMKGAEMCSNAELLAILINHGTREKTALDLAREVMKLGKNDLNELGKLSIKDFMKIKGIGLAKAVTITSWLELSRRRQARINPDKMSVTSSVDIAHYLRSTFKDYRHEVFVAIFLNRANKITHHEVISEGGITCTVADPRIILRKALEQNALGIILSHNHPSGNLRPSCADEELTYKVKEAAGIFDIKVLDHIIVSEEGYYSFADEGRM
jgi:DNA repair protein RadC